MKAMDQVKLNQGVKNAVNKMIKNISVIAVFVSLGIIALLYIGPDIQFTSEVVFRLAVPSFVLAISVTIIYELWVTNGRRTGREEQEYIDLLAKYAVKSDKLHYPTMQDFLDYERDRRYDVEYDRLTRMLEREQSLLDKLKNTEIKKKFDNFRIYLCEKRIRKITRARDTIKIKMPYEKSEEFDYLRYNVNDVIYKEYRPGDAKAHMAKRRAKRHSLAITFVLVGLNILSIGGSMGNLWVALIMTVLAAFSIMFAIVTGFSDGYNNIKVVSTGVYKTAVSFCDQAVAYCIREDKDLYYNGPTIWKEPDLQEKDKLDGNEFEGAIEPQQGIDFFKQASDEIASKENISK